MRIEDIVNITDGELVNSGYITDINFFADEIQKVKRECLFISNDIDEIKEAINKGSYGILFSQNLPIIDEEIAWIKVDNIDEALLKLLKYKFLTTTLYVTNDITLQIIKSINKDKRVAILDELKAEFLNDNFIYITSDEKITSISLNKKSLNKVDLKVMNASTFITNFVFENKKYSLIFPPLYLDELKEALYFFKANKLAYHLKDVKLDRFRPQFINSKYEKVEFGRSDRVVIYGIRKDKYFIREINYICENMKHAKVKFFDKSNIDTFFNEKFNFAILVECEVELNEATQIEIDSLFE
ncbi:MAG: hypothetical protein GXO40_03665 [Epsilonproteobacteria bacterium]|nr:hypothetical protein [Campylobacterota bacterium]